MYTITLEKSTGNYYRIETEDETMLPRILNAEGIIDLAGVKFYDSTSLTWQEGRIIIPNMFLVSIDIVRRGEE